MIGSLGDGLGRSWLSATARICGEDAINRTFLGRDSPKMPGTAALRQKQSARSMLTCLILGLRGMSWPQASLKLVGSPPDPGRLTF